MLLIPERLGKIVAAANDSDNGTRWKTSVVCIDGDKLIATDTKILAVITIGDCDMTPKKAGLASLENDEAIKGIIPAAAWRAAFEANARLRDDGQAESSMNVVGIVSSVVDGKAGVTLAAAGRGDNSDELIKISTPFKEGRFPPYEAVFPKKQPLFKLSFDPRLLQRLLEVVIAAAGDEEMLRMDMYIHGDDKPAVFVADGRDGQTVRAMIMPMTP